MKRILCCWIIIFANYAEAQVVFDAYGMATSSADLFSSKGIFISKNPASIASIEFTSIQTSQIIPYSIPNFSTNAFSISGRIKNKCFALEYAQSGIHQLKAHYLSLTTGLKLSKNIDLGIKIINRTQAILEEEKSVEYHVEAGLIQQLNKKIKSAIYLKYRTTKAISEFNKTTVFIGISYLIDPKFISYLKVSMDEEGQFNSNVALEYNLKKYIHCRIGWNGNENGFCGGLGYCLKNINIDVSTSYHNNLGMSYGAGLCYKISKK